MPPKPPKPPRQPGQPIRTERDRALGEIDAAKFKESLRALDEQLKDFKKNNKVVEVQVALAQRDQLTKDLDKVNEQLGKAKQATEAFKSAWQGVTSTAQQAAIGLATSAVSTATAGGRSSFGQIHSESFKYRHDTQAAATAAGKSFEEVGNRISLISTKTSRMSSEINDYTRDVARMTGSWDSAADGVEAFSKRARQMDVPLHAFKAMQAGLETTFGVKGTQKIDDFFGVLDAQARKSGITAAIAVGQWNAIGSSISRIATAAPATLTAQSAYFAGHAANPQEGIQNQGAMMEYMSPLRLEYMNRRHMRQGKGSIFDESGHLKKGTLNDIEGEAAARLRHRFPHRDAAIRKLIMKYGWSRPMAQSVYDYNPGEVKALENMPADHNTADEDWQKSATGYGDAALAQKNRADNAFGLPRLGAADWITARGGGRNGLLLGAGTDVLNAGITGFGGALLGAGARPILGAATRTAALVGRTAVSGVGALGGAGSLALGTGIGAAALGEGYLFNKALEYRQQGLDYASADKAQAAAAHIDVPTLRRLRQNAYRGQAQQELARHKFEALPGKRGSLENPVNLGTLDTPGYKDAGPHLSKSIVDGGAYGSQVQSQRTGPQDVSLDKSSISDMADGFANALRKLGALHVIVDQASAGGIETPEE